MVCLEAVALLEIAIRNLKRRKVRSWLTILGIVIGVALVITLISFGLGVEASVKEMFGRLGANVVIITGGAGYRPEPMFDESDVRAVERVRGVEVAAGIAFKTVFVRKKESKTLAYLSAVEAEKMEKILREGKAYSLSEGRFPRKGRLEAVVGVAIARDLDLRVGDKVEVLGKEVKVVGVFEDMGNELDNRTFVLPEDVVKKEFGVSKYNMIYAKTALGGNVKEIADRIEKILEKRVRGDFTVSTPEEMQRRIGSILSLISFLLIGIASISLLVGGIGIMNTMYMAVLERTKEIGIMRAIGATKEQILLLFLLESGLIGLIGGLFGAFLGFVLAKILSYVGSMFFMVSVKFVFPPWLFGVAAGLSFLVGTLAGVLPALRAANLNIVSTLRYE